MKERVALWLVRALLAILLLFTSELLLWTNPQGHILTDWLRLIVAYVALSALLLDLTARFRMHDIFGMRALAGGYGLLTSLLVNPQTALYDVPRTWATRVLGAHTLMGLIALVLLVLLMANDVKRLVPVLGGLGLFWGVWARWIATFTEIAPAEPALSHMLVYAAVTLVAVFVLLLLASRYTGNVRPHALRLSLLEWPPVLLVMAGLLITQLEVIDTVSLIVLLLLVGYCVMLVWFQARTQGPTLLDSSLPVHTEALLALLLSAALFLVAAAVSYSLPFAAGSVLVEIFIALFAGFGLVWLPTISLVMGVRSYRRITRQRRL